MSLVETESYGYGAIHVHVYECSECGHTCEVVNGEYDYCPHCTAPNFETVYSRYFSNMHDLANNYFMLEVMLKDKDFIGRLNILQTPIKEWEKRGSNQ